MRRLLIVLAVTAVARPAFAEGNPKLTAGLLIAAEVTLALDAMQTLSIARAKDGSHETNIILGRHPSDAAVLGYFATVMLTTAVVTYLVPDRYRVMVPVSALAIEVPLVGHNFAVGCRLQLPF